MSKKGITPVVGAVLLIGISVAASVSAFTFLNDVQNSLQESSEEKISSQQEDLRKSINIEFVYNSTDNHTLLSVRNTGEIAVLPKDGGRKTWSLFIDGRPVESWEFENAAYESEDTVSIDPQGTVTINTSVNYPPADTEQNIQLSGASVSDTHVCYHTGSESC